MFDTSSSLEASLLQAIQYAATKEGLQLCPIATEAGILRVRRLEPDQASRMGAHLMHVFLKCKSATTDADLQMELEQRTAQKQAQQLLTNFITTLLTRKIALQSDETSQAAEIYIA